MTVIALNWITLLQCVLCCIYILAISEAVDVKLDAATQHHVLGGKSALVSSFMLFQWIIYVGRTKFLYNSTWPAGIILIPSMYYRTKLMLS